MFETIFYREKVDREQSFVICIIVRRDILRFFEFDEVFIQICLRRFFRIWYVDEFSEFLWRFVLDFVCVDTTIPYVVSTHVTHTRWAPYI
jgi:hypothetical protein